MKPPATDQYPEQVTDLLQQIAAALPSYEEDGLARFERPEIAAVEGDLARFGENGGDAVFPEDFAHIKADWERLVGLDQTLQREHLV